MKRLRAFTLAEVLITFVIIGVIAAMTIPNIIARYQEQKAISGLKKAYATMKQAFELAKIEYGTMDNWGLSETPNDVESALKISEIFMKYLRVSKNCGTGQGCFPQQKYLYGSALDYNILSVYSKFVLDDGMLITFRSDGGKTNRIENLKVYATFAVDINGFAKPNTVGKDVFAFHITKDTILPEGVEGELEQPLSTCSLNKSGWGCTAWVLYKENMDYLKGKTVSW